MKIYVKRTIYQKVNGKWKIFEKTDEKRISEKRYNEFKNGKLRGDRRTFEYYYEFDERMLVRLSNTENEIKVVWKFSFKK